MKKFQLDQINTLVICIAIFFISQMIITVCIMILQIDSINARKLAVSKREETLQIQKDSAKQNDYIICILKIHPEERTNSNIEECKNKTVDK